MRITFFAKMTAVILILASMAVLYPTNVHSPTFSAAGYELFETQQNKEQSKYIETRSGLDDQLAQAAVQAEFDNDKYIDIINDTMVTEQEPTEQEDLEYSEQALQYYEQQAVPVLNTGYLIGITQPDYEYRSKAIILSEADRWVLERLVMGEAGTQGFLGCALVAQTIRDTMLQDNIATVEEVRVGYGYCGSLDTEPNQDVRNAVRYIFDEGKAVVQHSLMYFYETTLCSSAWHETQNHIVTYNTTKFFARVEQ